VDVDVVDVARSATSIIRSRLSISSPIRSTSDASRAVLRGLIRAQYAASRCMSARLLVTGVRVATSGIPRHLSASRRPSGQAAPAELPASFTVAPSAVVPSSERIVAALPDLGRAAPAPG